MAKELKRVVVTGMGAITPLGYNTDEFWKNIVAGKSGVDMIKKFETTHFGERRNLNISGIKSMTGHLLGGSRGDRSHYFHKSNYG